MAAEGEFPKIDGDILFASEVNLLRPVMQVYTGTGFNSSQSGAGNTESSFELDAITSTQAKSAAFVKVKITGTSNSDAVSGGIATTELKAQIKETGQSYADIISYKIHSEIITSSEITITNTYEIIATLTVGMKTNGFQIKVFSKSTGIQTGPNDAASFTNIQTIQELA